MAPKSDTFLLSNSWTKLKVFRLIGFFPFNKIELENGNAVLERKGFLATYLRILLWNTLGFSCQWTGMYYAYQSSGLESIVEFTRITNSATNKTTTDLITGFSLVVTQTLLYFFFALVLYGKCIELPNVLRSFDSVKDLIAKSPSKKKRTIIVGNFVIW